MCSMYATTSHFATLFGFLLHFTVHRRHDVPPGTSSAAFGAPGLAAALRVNQVRERYVLVTTDRQDLDLDSGSTGGTDDSACCPLLEAALESLRHAGATEVEYPMYGWWLLGHNVPGTYYNVLMISFILVCAIAIGFLVYAAKKLKRDAEAAEKIESK